MKNPGVIIILSWLVWSALHYFTLSQYGVSHAPSLYDSLVNNILLAVLCTGAGFTIRYYRPDISKTIVILTGILILSFLHWWIFIQIISVINFNDSSYNIFLGHSKLPRLVISFLLITLSVTIGWIIHYNNEFLEEKNRSNETSKLVKDAELTNLVQKIQPHFLFNTLNSVNALIQTDPVAAKKMVEELSGFLRGSLNSSNGKKTILSDEINQLKLYLAIEKVRFGDRLNSVFESDIKVSQMTLPPLLLQPLVENAIKFGLYDTLGPVTIKIKSWYENPFIFISVSNPFDDYTSQHQTGTGFGLQSLQRRLELYFNRNDLLEINRSNNIFTATLKIPQV